MNSKAVILVASFLWISQITSAQSVLYVDADATGSESGASWDDAYTSLQPALTTAEILNDSGVVQIWIAEGIYTPTTQHPNYIPCGACGGCGTDLPARAQTFIVGDNMELYGGFSGTESLLEERSVIQHATIISGDLNGDDLPGFVNRADNSYTVVHIDDVLDPQSGATAVLDGLFIEGGQSDVNHQEHGLGAGLLVWNGADATIRRCIIRDNLAIGLGAGFYVAPVGGPLSTTASFQGCLIYDNRILGGCPGSITSQAPVGGFGEAATGEMINCTIAYNSGTSGVVNLFASSVPGNSTTKNSIIVENRNDANNLMVGGQGDPSNHTDLTSPDNDPKFIDGAGRDFRLDPSSPAIDSGDNTNLPPGLSIDLDEQIRIAPQIAGAPLVVDQGVFETNSFPATQLVLYVDADAPPQGDGSSWSNAYIHLQDALTRFTEFQTLGLGSLNQIWIAEGTYLPDGGYINDIGFTTGTGDVNATFEPFDGLNIYGSFVGNETSIEERPDIGTARSVAPTTKLSGNLDNNTESVLDGVGYEFNSKNIMRREDAHTGTVTLNGLTLLSGNAVGNLAANDDGGGAVRNMSPNLTLKLNNCLLFVNLGENWGGALTSLGPVEARGCFFAANRVTGEGTGSAAGGAMYVKDAGGYFVDCYFLNNKATKNGSSYGGAVCANPSTGNPYHFQNCSFIQNDSFEYGGAAYHGPTPGNGERVVYHNCLFVGNGESANEGGAVWISRERVRFINSTFAANGPDTFGNGSAIWIAVNARADIRNCLFTANKGTNDTIAGSPPSFGTIVNIDHTLREIPNSSFVGNLEVVTNNSTQVADIGFIDPLGIDGIQGTEDDDYRLAEGSPALDTGDDGSYSQTPYADPDGFGGDYLDLDNDNVTNELLPGDLDSGVRFINLPGLEDDGSDIDMGCYEVQICQDCPGDRKWSNVNGGLFDVGLNWFPGVAGIGNTAVFDIAGTYAVAFTQDTSNFALRVHNGDVTFDLNGWMYDLTAITQTPIIIGDTTSASLTIGDGLMTADTLSIAQESMSTAGLTVDGLGTELTVADDMTVGFLGNGSFILLDGATAFALAVDAGARPGSSSSMVLDGVGTVMDVPFIVSVDNGTLDVRNGAQLNAGVGFFGGVVLFDNGVLTGDGTINGSVVNFGDIFPSTAAPLASSSADRGIGAGLTVTGDYLQLGQLQETGESTGVLGVTVGGDPLAPSSNRLNVLGSADIAGGLIVEFDSGFIPDLDNAAAVSVLDAGAVNGRFDVAFVPGLPLGADGAGRFMKVVYPTGASRSAIGAMIALKKGATHESRAKRLEIKYPESRNISRAIGASVVLEIDSLSSDIDLGSSNNFSVGGQPASAAAGLLDGDSDIDLVVTIPDAADPTGTAGSIVILPNDGNNPDGSWIGFAGSTIISSGIDPSDVAIAEFNGQPGLDIAVINRAEDNISILLNDGSGNFTLHSNTTVNDLPHKLIVEDLNGDGLADVSVIGKTLLNFPDPGTPPGLPVATVLLNEGPSVGGIWPGLDGLAPQNFAIPEDPDDIETGDFDDDDDCDLVVLGTDTVAVLTNLGGFGAAWNGFDVAGTHPVGNQPSAADTADLDNNGFIDIVTTNAGDGTISVLLNTAGVFAPVVNLPVGNNPTSIVAVDLDQMPDGDLDLAVVVENDLGDPVVRILRNDLTDQQLVFAPASDHLQGTGPLLVLSSDVDNDGDDDLITVNAQTGGALRMGASSDEVTVVLNLACDGDINADGTVDVNDISFVLFRLGDPCAAPGPPTCDGDANNDGAIDVNDISYVLFRLGNAC